MSSRKPVARGQKPDQTEEDGGHQDDGPARRHVRVVGDHQPHDAAHRRISAYEEGGKTTLAIRPTVLIELYGTPESRDVAEDALPVASDA